MLRSQQHFRISAEEDNKSVAIVDANNLVPKTSLYRF